jgi:iron complex outermembrane receptor protein
MTPLMFFSCQLVDHAREQTIRINNRKECMGGGAEMKYKLLGIGAALVLIMVFSGLAGFAEEFKFKSPEEMFKNTKYTEEGYYRTDRMLLSATKTLMESRKAPAINSVITAQEIRNMGARNLFDVLDKIPGFSTSWNQIKGIINVRGVQTDYAEKVLLMIDGVRIRDSYTGSPTFLFGEDLMVDNIKRIEVVRGPGSALFGANAFVGVINIITKDPEDYPNDKVMTSATVGSFNTQEYNVTFGHNKGDFKACAHFNYLDTDGERPWIEEDALSNSTVYNRAASLAPGRAQGFDRKLDAGVKLKYKGFSLKGRIINKKRGAFAGVLGALNNDSYLDTLMGLVDLDYHKEITNNLNIAGKFYFVHMDYEAYSELYPPGFTGGNDMGLIGIPKFKNNVIGTELSANYTLGDHLITPGLVFENDRQYDVRSINNFADPFSPPVDTTETSNFNKNVTRRVWAAYIQDMWEITAYDSLTLGVRFDHYSDFGGTTNPRVGFVHEFKNEMILKLLYGKAFRAPNNNELYSINNPVVVGNPNLKPETIQTYEASFEIPFQRYFTFDISCFYNVINDIIQWDTSKPAPYTFINGSGESNILGTEAELKFNFGKNRYGYANVSYQHSEDAQGRPLPYVARWMGNVGYNHEFFGKLNANVNLYWIGDRTRAVGDTRDKAPPAALVDFTLILKHFYKSFEIRGSVFNLFNSGFVAPSTITTITDDLPLHGRMFLAEVRYTF